MADGAHDPGAVHLRVPTRCSACRSRGYLDHIDPFKKVQYERCPVCLTTWELAEDEILALNRLADLLAR